MSAPEERKADPTGRGMRLQRYLARAGVASRRASERLIAQGRVRVDGRVVTRPGIRVVPGVSVVEMDGEPLEPRPATWLAVHKPPGYLCSRGDPRERPTVYDLLPEGAARQLFHVGRLDFLSEGLLLLTNEGEVAHRLLHPGAGTARRYEVRLAAPVPPDLAEHLVEGVRLEDGVARATRAELRPGNGPEKRLLLTLREGRNRQIRRMLRKLGVRVRSLKRVAFGPVTLGGLAPGDHRELTAAEIERLRSAARAATEDGS